jgi:cell division protein FtsI (penicillin-binding protein 3)
VLDAQTGEVLAMANMPAFNPNNRSSMKPYQTRNRAVVDAFEPGSTLKPLTIAAALSRAIWLLTGGFMDEKDREKMASEDNKG